MLLYMELYEKVAVASTLSGMNEPSLPVMEGAVVDSCRATRNDKYVPLSTVIVPDDAPLESLDVNSFLFFLCF